MPKSVSPPSQQHSVADQQDRPASQRPRVPPMGSRQGGEGGFLGIKQPRQRPQVRPVFGLIGRTAIRIFRHLPCHRHRPPRPTNIPQVALAKVLLCPLADIQREALTTRLHPACPLLARQPPAIDDRPSTLLEDRPHPQCNRHASPRQQPTQRTHPQAATRVRRNRHSEPTLANFVRMWVSSSVQRRPPRRSRLPQQQMKMLLEPVPQADFVDEAQLTQSGSDRYRLERCLRRSQ